MPKKKTKERNPAKSENELRSMMLSVIQEGYEKAEEVDSKTEDEFNTLRRKIINSEIEKIEVKYNKKESLCETQLQIEHGKLIQDSNLQLVDYKMKILEEIKEDVKLDIIQDMKDNKRKQRILKRLILQSLYKVLEKDVIIRCRRNDEILIRNILPEIEKNYEHATKIKITIYIDTEKYLSETSLPGILIKSPGDKISISNSLEERLQQIMISSLPVLSHIFFGTSQMRK